MEKSVLVPIANGSEEIEAVTIIDVLRRAGARVTVASVNDLQITASRGVRITADCPIDACANAIFDLIALPGGMPGAQHLHDSLALKALIVAQNQREGLLGAICAAPAVVLMPHGLLERRRATCHPNFKDQLADPAFASLPVVVDGNVVTSQGPGTALEFALTLVELLYDKDKRNSVAVPMMAT